MISLCTKRLIIEDHVQEDLESLHKLISDPTAMYYLPEIHTHTLEESQDNLNVAIAESQSPHRTKYFFKIAWQGSRQYIGEIGFTVRLDTPVGKITDLGYFILPEFWGQGLVTEAAREVIRFAFEEAGVLKIETGCLKENRGSEKVMLNLGMIKEADFRMRVWHDGQLKDRVEYRLLKDEWNQKHAQGV